MSADVGVELKIAEIRARMAEALSDDAEALAMLDRVFPADWGDAPLAVIWMLGNAARFATNMTGFGAEYAQNWLDRLVHEDGEPREESRESGQLHVLLAAAKRYRLQIIPGDDAEYELARELDYAIEAASATTNAKQSSPKKPSAVRAGGVTGQGEKGLGDG